MTFCFLSGAIILGETESNYTFQIVIHFRNRITLMVQLS